MTKLRAILRTVVTLSLLLIVQLHPCTAKAEDTFLIHPPGKLKGEGNVGAADYKSYVPGMRFPLADVRATLNSQIHSSGGFLGDGGTQCDADNYNEIWWDNFCEKRSGRKSNVVGCKYDSVHAGVDIRGGTAEACKGFLAGKKNQIKVLAVIDGVISKITAFTVVLSTETSRFYYFHINRSRLNVRLGQAVNAGDVIGFLSDDMGGRAATTYHLHLEHRRVNQDNVWVAFPLYCDLVLAYERDRDKRHEVIGGGRRCGEGEDEPDPNSVTTNAEETLVSYWKLDDAEITLSANGDARHLAFGETGLPKGRKKGDIFFDGVASGKRYQGNLFSHDPPDCKPAGFPANGHVLSNGRIIFLTGNSPVRDEQCAETAKQNVTYEVTFDRVAEELSKVSCGLLIKDRRSFTEISRNWIGLTMYQPWEQWPEYVRTWPGLLKDQTGRPEKVLVNDLGGTVPAFATDESGVGIWWYWLLVRRGLGPNGKPDKKITIAEMASLVSGGNKALNELYLRLSKLYFSGSPTKDTEVDLNSAEERWALAQMVFHAESGRKPLISKETFEEGVRLGTDVSTGRFTKLDDYVAKCEVASNIETASPEDIIKQQRAENIRRQTTEAETDTRGAVSVRLGGPGANALSVPVRLYARSFALVIGIDDYTNGWKPLRYAVKDAMAVASELEKHHGFEVTLRTDAVGESDDNLDLEKLRKIIRDFMLSYGQDPEARIVIWFAGHGHTIQRDSAAPQLGYIVPADGESPKSKVGERQWETEARFKKSALSMGEFGELLTQAGARHVLAIFDSCFSGTVFADVRGFDPATSTIRHLRRDISLPVRQIITSGEATQQVSDDGQFRRTFIKALRGQTKADLNDDSFISGSELGPFLTSEIKFLTSGDQIPRYGKIRREGLTQGDVVFEVTPAN